MSTRECNAAEQGLLDPGILEQGLLDPGTLDEDRKDQEGSEFVEPTQDDDPDGGLHMRVAPTAHIDEVDELDALFGGQASPLIPGVGVGVGVASRPASFGGVPLCSVASARALHRSATSASRFDSVRTRYRGTAGRKQRRRAVFKNGECNVLKSRMQHRRLRYLQDLFTTFVDSQWRWTLLVFALSFVLSWLVFAAVWWLIAFTHGDLDAEHQRDDAEWTPCVVQIHDFTSCFLFSIETQHTIGYGSRSTTEECPEAIFVMCLQSICGVMIQAFMVGIVFAKMTRPKRRTQTLLFSRHAVVCQRDGALCLMFRVGDMRKSHIIGTAVRAQLIRSRTTKEGEVIPQCQIELAVGTDGGPGDLFFIWPMTIVHRIDKASPFFRYSAADLVERDSRLEVVVILEGTIESTGQTTQARSSYLPSEILWGHRFEPMVEYSKDRQGYEVDYSRFNNTYQVDTPLCSARELQEFYKIQDDSSHPQSDERGVMLGCMSAIGSPISSPRPPSRQRHAPDATRLRPN